MTDWKTIEEDPKAWENRPFKIELLFQDGQIGKFFVIPKGENGADLIADDVCFSGQKATHWRPK